MTRRGSQMTRRGPQPRPGTREPGEAEAGGSCPVLAAIPEQGRLQEGTLKSQEDRGPDCCCSRDLGRRVPPLPGPIPHTRPADALQPCLQIGDLSTAHFVLGF